MPSRSTVWIGMPPATLASIARFSRAPIARSHRSAPCSAINSLFAVTTDFPPAMAASMISRATPQPPTSSATISTSGESTTSRQSVVFSAESKSRGNVLCAMPRLHSARTWSGNPSFSAISRAFSARISSVPEPTLPRPIIPILTGCMRLFHHQLEFHFEHHGIVCQPDAGDSEILKLLGDAGVFAPLLQEFAGLVADVDLKILAEAGRQRAADSADVIRVARSADLDLIQPQGPAADHRRR